MVRSLNNSGETPKPHIINRLLASLDDSGRRRFVAKMERLELKTQQLFYAPEQRIDRVYFPEDCVLAMLTVMQNGATIEAATVGREGASWISASFKSPTMPCQTMVAIPGYAYKVPAEVVEHEIRQKGDFHDMLSHYAHVLLVQTLRSTACNGLHNLEQRCARWMLATLDRTDINRFDITHSFLATAGGAADRR